MTHEVKAIDNSSLPALRTLIVQEPVRHCFAASRVDAGGRGFWKPSFPDILGYFEDGHLMSALLLGANVVPINTSQIARREFADVLSRAGRRASSIVGPSDEALDLWDMLKDSWGRSREIRANQPVLAMTERSALQADDELRYSSLADLDILFPACVEMFTQEVGISPIAGGSANSYRARISELVSTRRSFIKRVDDEVVFKAEIGCLGGGVAQIQGVWVHPAYRGQGIAGPAMAAVVQRVIEDIAPTASLYVNDYNTPALALYKSVGFHQVDTFATILF